MTTISTKPLSSEETIKRQASTIEELVAQVSRLERIMQKTHAFPSHEPCEPPEISGSIWYPGMSLRDWFAGMALQGRIVSDIHGAQSTDHRQRELAQDAYGFADAMLKERDRE